MGIALYRQEVRKIMRTSKGKYEAEKLLLYSKLSDEQAKAYERIHESYQQAFRTTDFWDNMTVDTMKASMTKSLSELLPKVPDELAQTAAYDLITLCLAELAWKSKSFREVSGIRKGLFS